jgi:hypothetical protein
MSTIRFFPFRHLIFKRLEPLALPLLLIAIFTSWTTIARCQESEKVREVYDRFKDETAWEMSTVISRTTTEKGASAAPDIREVVISLIVDYKSTEKNITSPRGKVRMIVRCQSGGPAKFNGGEFVALIDGKPYNFGQARYWLEINSGVMTENSLVYIPVEVVRALGHARTAEFRIGQRELRLQERNLQLLSKLAETLPKDIK